MRIVCLEVALSDKGYWGSFESPNSLIPNENHSDVDVDGGAFRRNFAGSFEKKEGYTGNHEKKDTKIQVGRCGKGILVKSGLDRLYRLG